MKKINVLFASFLVSFMGAGVFAGVSNRAKTKEVNAATSSVTLAGSFNGWSTTAEPLTLNGDYWTIQKTLAVDDTFKIVVNGSDWVGDGDGVTWCSGLGSEGKGQNFKVLTSGAYLIKAVKTIGDYGDKSYGIVFEQAVIKHTVTKYKVLDGATPVSIGSEQVNDGTSYAVPGDRYEKGYTFGGWYTNPACTSAYSAGTVNADLNLYAKYTTRAATTGTVYVDLRDSSWSEAAANYAVMFMDKTSFDSEVDEWSTYVTGTASGERLVEIPYSVGFDPQKILVVRYNSTYSQTNWNSEKFPTDGNKWGQTEDLNFSATNNNANVRIGTTVTDSKNKAYVGFPKVIGGVNPAWADMLYLTSVKSNGSNHAEYYSTSVTLTAGQEFKMQVAPYESGDYSGTYSTHDSIKSNFSGGGSSNITVVTGGTYAFYFDSFSSSLYITKVELAEADEWAQYFLNNVGCDSTGVALPSGWSACASAYSSLSGAAKDIIYGATAKEDGNYVEQAVARYDYAVAHHSSLEKFIKNSSNVVRASAIISNVPSVLGGASEGNMITIAVIISVTSLTAIGGYFFFRKRKEN